MGIGRLVATAIVVGGAFAAGYVIKGWYTTNQPQLNPVYKNTSIIQNTPQGYNQKNRGVLPKNYNITSPSTEITTSTEKSQLEITIGNSEEIEHKEEAMRIINDAREAVSLRKTILENSKRRGDLIKKYDDAEAVDYHLQAQEANKKTEDPTNAYLKRKLNENPKNREYSPNNQKKKEYNGEVKNNKQENRNPNIRIFRK